jgi:monovalent cation:H+ antiporter-2, CPA2 family
MEPNAFLFRELTYIFVAAVAGGLVAWRLRLPLILGFVLGGIVISPFTPGPKIFDLHTFEELAEVGVVLLMFSIGVEFSLSELLSVKWVAVIGGICGIGASIGLAIGAARLMGWTTTQGMVIGATVSVASTMVLASLLADTQSLTTPHGRVMIGITLFEDLAVVMMTVMLPSVGSGHLSAAAWTIGKALVLLVPLAFLAVTVIPRILRKAQQTKNQELFLLVAIAICLATAALSHAAGFSTALGAFLAGFSISGSKDLHDAHAQLIPLRDAFVALFFVTIGALIQPQVLWHNLPLLVLMLVLIVPGKFVVWALVVKLFGYPTRTAVAAAAGLTQIGELSFVVVRVAHESGLVGEEVFNATLAASLLSIFINVFIVRAALAWTTRSQPIAASVAA